jgi:excinuclease ABC subunit C
VLISSKLDHVIGIGEIRRDRLLERFGSLEQLASASDEALREAGLNMETMVNLRKTLGN